MMLRFGWYFLVLAGCGPTEAPDEGPVDFSIRMENISAPGAILTTTAEQVDAKFAPGILVIHEEGFSLFTPGEPLRFPEMEPMVEDGLNEDLVNALKALPEVATAASFAALDESYASIPMEPGDEASLVESALPGMRLSLVTMFGESNDIFAATPSQGVPLFDAEGAPALGEISDQIAFYDAGTEVNEEPGVGPNQPGRSPAPDTGEDEGGVVQAVNGVDAMGFTYPAAGTWLAVTIDEVVE